MATNGMGHKAPGRERVTNSGQRKTMGTSVYQKPIDSPSGADFRTGMLEHKQGVDKGAPELGPTSKRKPMKAQSMGARYAVQVNKPAVGFEVQNVQSNGRIMPSAIGARPRDNFWGGSRVQ